MHRNSLEVLIDILTILSEDHKPHTVNWIRASGNTSLSIATRIVAHCKRKGFITGPDTSLKYSLTEEGLRFLEDARKVLKDAEWNKP